MSGKKEKQARVVEQILAQPPMSLPTKEQLEQALQQNIQALNETQVIIFRLQGALSLLAQQEAAKAAKE